MLSNANKEQLTEISEYIDSEFGITDDAGRILFYSGAGNQDAAEVELAAIFAELQNEESLNLFDLPPIYARRISV